MRINTNTAALNSYNQLKNTNNNLSKSLSRLSSGKRINGAADDAAGLAISEKMGSQTRGLSQAQRNAQDGISMIQTAEGALKESHSILQRMRELSVQSANDTNTEADRAEIQKEVDQLSQELTRIGETTEFNTQKLLDGTLDDTKFQIGANEDQNMEIDINDMRADALKVEGDGAPFESGTHSVSTATATIDGTDYDNVLQDSDGEDIAYSTDGNSWVDGNEEEILTTAATLDSSGDNLEVASSHKLDSGSYSVATLTSDVTVDGADYSYSLTDGTDVVGYGDGTDWVDTSGEELFATSSLADGADLQVVGTTGIDVSSQEKANEAISVLDDAIATVSGERSKLGAVQNRLDHTINNLNTAEENLTAAESRISDVDMAKEMMNMSKQQILSQAGTAMMAQANQLPQGVLQLLG